VGPLLRIVWAEDLRLTISVSQPKHETYTKAMTGHNSFGGMFDVFCQAVNHVLHSIQQGALSLKRLWFQISHICLRRDGTGGSVVYITAGHSTLKYKPAYGHTRHFVVDPDQSLRMLRRPKPTFSNLPQDLHDRTMREVFTHDNVRRISIDNAPHILQAIRPLAFYCRCRHGFDGMYVNNYVQMNSFQIELKTSQRVGRFQESERLGKLVELVHCGQSQKWHWGPTVSLESWQDEACSSEGVCAGVQV
jgi:hypothetical protein